MDKHTEPQSTIDLGSSGLAGKEGRQEQESNQPVIAVNTADDSSSSSEEEDLALLEEITRKKAELEAKLRAKKLRRAAKNVGADGVQQTSCETSVPRDSATPQSCSTASGDRIVTPKRELPEILMDSPSFPGSTVLDNPNDLSVESPSDVITPTKSNTPLVSPGFRTPSPPSGSRFMSPPSGASSRKRQHSPSPLRASSLSAQRVRYGSLTPTSSRYLRGLGQGSGTPSKVSSFNEKMKLEGGASSTSWTEDPFHDLLDEDLDSALLDALLGDDFDQDTSEASGTDTGAMLPLSVEDNKETTKEECSAAYSTLDTAAHGATTPSLTDVVESQRQKREAEVATQKAPKATFYTVTADSEPLSTTESARLGHVPDFDPLTELRIRNREKSCEDVATMTRNLRIIPIKDGDRIREHSTQRSSSGLLPSPAPGGVLLTGGLGSTGSTNNNNNTPGLKSESWILAGVVGAKSKQKMTGKKVRYCHFQLSDLRSNAINVFMFRSVMDKHYDKLKVGNVVAIMDPKILNQAERVGTLGVEVEHADCLLVIGTSTDFGLCEAVKLNGESCGRILDKRGSAYCNYHIMMTMHKRRNQRGSMIIGTSSIQDLEGAPSQAGSATLSRKIGAGGQSSLHSEGIRMIAREPRETTYIFDDGGVGTSSMMDRGSSKNGPQQLDDGLSAFLMSQNNLGGQYLRQAKTSKDVAWAKDVTSPKTPTKSTELFPAEMIRRMGYDPVTGQFVPGSPKRSNDDLEARERSIRLLTERVKSPPASMQSLSNLSPVRRRTIEVKGTTRAIAQPRSSKLNASRGDRGVQGDAFFASPKPSGVLSAGQKWVSLDDGSSEEDVDHGSPLLSLSHQRAKILQETRANKGRLLDTSANATSRPASSNVVEQSTKIPQGERVFPSARMILKRRPVAQPSTIDPVIPKSGKSGTDKASTTRLNSLSKPSVLASGADTPLHASEASAMAQGDHVGKKPRFIDFSDSE
ncbi:hypothetical protein BGZ65_001372 [Modicella reniformis]|uniref:Zinc finger Mcm10/DnaG-type domain-containing protein n=1 Tax=Modicella reniformis TaxID=1440133 RepID=A0A9P6MJE4_9FUNG|nr:hypothetical protein BGZ65_001372 [Modicella reniformis]